MQHDRGAVPLGEPVHLGDQGVVVRLGLVRDRPGIRGRVPPLHHQDLEAMASPDGVDAGTHRDPPRDPEQPFADRLAAPDRTRLADQDQERGLEGVVGVVRIAQDHLTDAQDHRPMPFDQRGECRLGLCGVLPGQEPPQELAIAPFPDHAQLVEHPELIGQEAGSFTSHREGPYQPRNRCGRHHRGGARVRGDDSRILFESYAMI